MKFGLVAVRDAAGATLAHTVRWPDGTLRKGITLREKDIATLHEAGVETVMAARPDAADVAEDEVAESIANALVSDPTGQNLRLGPAAKGRVNVFAETAGLFRVQATAVNAVNRTDEAITLATLPDCTHVARRQLVATVKVIPYAVAESVVNEIVNDLTAGLAVVAVKNVVLKNAALLVTRSSGTPAPLAARGVPAVQGRLAALGIPLERNTEVAHDTQTLIGAIAATTEELVLILGDTATSDRNDVAAAAIEGAGGEIIRFGMPVDPGNLLLLARLEQRWAVVLPGCARSPKLNGADWVLERIACGVPVSAEDIAGMGVGGLLHEIPQRPAPRVGGAETSPTPKVSAILLAAGMSRRMGEQNKLLVPVAGEPLVVRAARALVQSRVSEVVVVTGHQSEAVKESLDSNGIDGIRFVENTAYEEGIASSIRTGMEAIARDADAVVIAFADMPGTSGELVNQLVHGFDPSAGHAICRLRGPKGEPGHPVLFGRRFFEALGLLVGDQGAREVVKDHAGVVLDIPATEAAVVDLDTEEDWQRWRKSA